MAIGKADIHLLSGLRKLFFWNYARKHLAMGCSMRCYSNFIFLTPKSWFENSERRGSQMHQIPTASTVLVGAELVENAKDKGQVEQVVRTFTGRNDVQVLNVRKVVDKDGKTRGYEVDIR